MGQEATANVIGLDLASLTREPQAVFELGRDDITESRPGQILIEEVRKFQATGGFRELEAVRDEEYAKEKELDGKIGKREMKEFRVTEAVKPVVSADLRQENQD
jgi:hypothetical protein